MVLNGTFTLTKEKWEEQTLKVIAALRLPFKALEHAELKRWITMAMAARQPLSLLTPFVARQKLIEQVQVAQTSVLSLLRPGQRISLALDCWSSPNHYSFMAITGYVNMLDMIISKINTIQVLY
jgi:hypothetical protein